MCGLPVARDGPFEFGQIAYPTVSVVEAVAQAVQVVRTVDRGGGDNLHSLRPSVQGIPEVWLAAHPLIPHPQTESEIVQVYGTIR